MPLNDKRIEMRKKVDPTSYQLIWTLLKDTFPQKMPEFSNLIIWFLTKWNEDRIIWFDDNNGGGDTKRRKNSTTTTTRNRNICFSMKLKLKEQGLILTIIIEQFIYSTENKQTWDKRQETHIHTTPQTHIHTSPAASRFIFFNRTEYFLASRIPDVIPINQEHNISNIENSYTREREIEPWTVLDLRFESNDLKPWQFFACIF